MTEYNPVEASRKRDELRENIEKFIKSNDNNKFVEIFQNEKISESTKKYIYEKVVMHKNKIFFQILLCELNYSPDINTHKYLYHLYTDDQIQLLNDVMNKNIIELVGMKSCYDRLNYIYAWYQDINIKDFCEYVDQIIYYYPDIFEVMNSERLLSHTRDCHYQPLSYLLEKGLNVRQISRSIIADLIKFKLKRIINLIITYGFDPKSGIILDVKSSEKHDNDVFYDFLMDMNFDPKQVFCISLISMNYE